MPTGLPSSTSPGRCRAVTRTLQQGATAEVTPGSWPGGSHGLTVRLGDGPQAGGMDPARPPGPALPCCGGPGSHSDYGARPGPAMPGRPESGPALGELAESDSPWHSLSLTRSGRLQSHGDSEDDRVTRALRRRGPAGAGPAGHSLADRRTRCDRVRPLQWSRLVPFNCLLSYGHRV